MFAVVEQRDEAVVARIYLESSPGKAEYVALNAGTAEYVRCVLALLRTGELRASLHRGK